MVAFPVLTAPPGCDRGQRKWLAEIFGDAGQECHQAGIFQNAAAERVGNGDVAATHDFQQAGNSQSRVFAQLQGVAVVFNNAAQDDVYLLQAGERFQPDMTVAHHEIIALNQGVTEICGKISVLEKGFSEGARRHHDNVRVLASGWGEGAQAVAHVLKE